MRPGIDVDLNKTLCGLDGEVKHKNFLEHDKVMVTFKKFRFWHLRGDQILNLLQNFIASQEICFIMQEPL